MFEEKGKAEKIKYMKHIGIYVRDFQGMIDFYKEALGFYELTRYEDSGNHIGKILKREGARVRICKLLTPFGREKGQGDMLELVCVPDNEEECINGALFAPGMAHIGLGVVHIHEVYQAVQEHGGQPVCDPMQVEENGNYMAFCRDMEGNYLELIENT